MDIRDEGRTNFAHIAHRSKQAGEEIMIFTKKPELQFFTTVPEPQLPDFFANAMTYLAAYFSMKTDGQVPPKVVLDQILQHCADVGLATLDAVVEKLEKSELEKAKKNKDN